eukprot:8683674-Pyramimonas_sp.AAC.1
MKTPLVVKAQALYPSKSASVAKNPTNLPFCPTSLKKTCAQNIGFQGFHCQLTTNCELEPIFLSDPFRAPIPPPVGWE